MNTITEQIKRKYAYDLPEEAMEKLNHQRGDSGMEGLSKYTLSIILDNLMGHVKKEVEQQREFFAEAIHQIKSPLAILRANWEEELNNTDLPLEIREKFAQNIETITRMSQLINKMLILSHTEVSRSNLNFQPVGLDEILNSIIEETSVLAETNNQEINAEYLPEMIVNGDNDRLYQLFFNIIDNAIKYTPEYGKITIRGRVENNIVIIDIQDTGPGIPLEEQSLIFNRFYRARNGNTKKVSGSGLGLAICKMIAEMHKGKINIKSEQGKGSTFRVLLPAMEN
jgi:signal transduction histidine kinase